MNISVEKIDNLIQYTNFRNAYEVKSMCESIADMMLVSQEYDFDTLRDALNESTWDMFRDCFVDKLLENDISLKSMVGSHKLSGVDRGTLEFLGDDYADSCVFSFTLDGVLYSAIENPSDGYRSHMRGLIKLDGRVTNNEFPPQDVMCIMRVRGADDWSTDDVLEMYDAITGKLVIAVGTRHVDDYYPCFHAEFNPQNMACNVGVRE